MQTLHSETNSPKEFAIEDIKIGKNGKLVKNIDVFTQAIHIKVLQYIFEHAGHVRDHLYSASKKVAEYIDYILELHTYHIQPVYNKQEPVTLSSQTVQGYIVPEPRQTTHFATGPMGGTHREPDRQEHSVHYLFKALAYICIFTKNLQINKYIVDALQFVKIKDPVMHLLYNAIHEELSRRFDEYPWLMYNPMFDTVITWAYQNNKITIAQGKHFIVVYTMFTLSEPYFLEIFTQDINYKFLYTTTDTNIFCDFIKIAKISMRSLLQRMELILSITKWTNRLQCIWFMGIIEHFGSPSLANDMCFYKYASVIRKLNSMRILQIEEQIEIAQGFINLLSKHVIQDISKVILEYL